MSHSEFKAEKATLTTHASIFFAAWHKTRHAPLFSPDLLSFTIYPTCDADLAQNEFLWHVVHDSSFALSTGRKILSRRIAISYPHLAGTPATLFALALPRPLAAFLEAVSLEEMRRSVIYMLADAAQGEDENGLRKMHSTLAPGIWRQLRSLLIRSARDFANGVSCSSASFMLDTALQFAQAHDYWKIDVEAAIFLPVRHTAFSVIKSDTRAASVLASLYADWATYAANELVWEVSLPEDTKRDGSRARDRRKVALETMMRLVREGRQSETWDRVSALRRCAENERSWIAKLPTQVVEHLLVPRIVLDPNDEQQQDDEKQNTPSDQRLSKEDIADDQVDSIAQSEMHLLPWT